jgi:hypothetical protein
MLEIDFSTQADAVRNTLATHGIHRALALLNDRTQYRYTGLYKLVGETMRAAYVFDRSAEYRTWLKVVPLSKSLCQFAIEKGEFLTSHASKDLLLADHPHASLIESYYGRLLKRRDGTPYGTFIHFDLEPQTISPRELMFLQEVTPLFLDYVD